MRHGARAVVLAGGALLAACSGPGDDGRVPAGMWTESQAASISSIRGTPVRVRSCTGLGTGLTVGSETFYRSFSCLAGARAAHETFDTVAVTYRLQPLGPFAEGASRYRLMDVRFQALSVP